MSRSALRIAGLTGGIASGKTTIAQFFREWGAFVVDADLVARDLTVPGGPVFKPLVLEFGEGILDLDGKIDRAALGRIVFADPARRTALEAILHPAIRRESRDRFERCAQEGTASVGIYEAALLVETGGWHEFDFLIVAACSADRQLERLMQRDSLGEDDARRRIAAQYPLHKKIELADHVIDCSGSLEQTRDRARLVWDALQTD